MAMMTGGSVGNKRELSVCMPIGFPADVELPPQSVTDVECSSYNAAWHEAVDTLFDGHETTGTYEAAKPPKGRKSVAV